MSIIYIYNVEVPHPGLMLLETYSALSPEVGFKLNNGLYETTTPGDDTRLLGSRPLVHKFHTFLEREVWIPELPV